MPLTEADVEQIALQGFAECGYACVFGPRIAPGEAAAERESYERLVPRAIRVTGKRECVGGGSLDEFIHQQRSIV